MVNNRSMKTLLTLSVIILIAGCGTTHDLVKDFEGKAYDSLAGAFTKYCEAKTRDGITGMVARQEALEARREIRQRGKGGPHGPTDKVQYLDDKTAYGNGPVVRIWCGGERVPVDLWQDFVRVK